MAVDKSWLERVINNMLSSNKLDTQNQMVIDKSWMERRLVNNMLSPEFQQGVEEFLDFAFAHPHFVLNGDKIVCPCKSCMNKRWDTRDNVKSHLLTEGFQNNYTWWTTHGDSPFVAGSLDMAVLRQMSDESVVRQLPELADIYLEKLERQMMSNRNLAQLTMGIPIEKAESLLADFIMGIATEKTKSLLADINVRMMAAQLRTKHISLVPEAAPGSYVMIFEQMSDEAMVRHAPELKELILAEFKQWLLPQLLWKFLSDAANSF